MSAREIITLSINVVVILLGIPGNLVIMTVYYKKKIKKSTDILIIAQAILDVAGAIIAVPTILRRRPGIDKNDYLCKLSIYLTGVLAYTSLYLMATIAVDRCILVKRPFGRRTTPKRAIAASVLCAMFAAVTQSYKVVSIEYRADRNSCQRRDLQPELEIAGSVLTSASFVVTLTMSIMCYAIIYMAIRKQAKVRALLIGGPKISTMSQTGPSNVKSSTHREPLDGHPPEPDVKASSSSGRVKCPADVSDTSNTPRHPQRNDSVREREDPQKGDPHAHILSTSGSRGVHTIVSGSGKVNIPFTSGPRVHDIASRSTTETNLSATAPSALTPTGDINANTNQKGDGTAHEAQGDSIAMANRGGNGTTPEAPATGDSNAMTNRGENRTTKMLLFTTIIFLLLWLPSTVLSHVPGDKLAAFQRQSTLHPALVSMGFSARSLNHIINIFVYWAVNKTFRQDCKKLFKKMINK